MKHSVGLPEKANSSSEMVAQIGTKKLTIQSYRTQITESLETDRWKDRQTCSRKITQVANRYK